jgi:Dihydroorotase and related cyclic amidohydrolases
MIIQLPDDKSINEHGLMHEGNFFNTNWSAGKPAMAEELIVARDIKLARYANRNYISQEYLQKNHLNILTEVKKETSALAVRLLPIIYILLMKI